MPENDETQFIAFSPIQAYAQTVSDLVELTRYFGSMENPTKEAQRQYLEAVDGLMDQLVNITSAIHRAVAQPMIAQVDEDVVAAYRDAVDASLRREMAQWAAGEWRPDEDGIIGVIRDFGGVVTIDPETGQPRLPDHDHDHDHGGDGHGE